MTLTEQWKKGELPSGLYWVMLDVSGDGEIMQTTLFISNGKPVGWCKKSIKEVLAPVPSYEEWRDLKDDLATCDKDLNNVCEQKEELYEENQQLKKENAQLIKFLEEFNALDVAKENQQLKELLYSLKCCLTSENIEPRIRVEKSLAKIEE